MSGKEAQSQDRQFTQEVPSRRETVVLDKQYKSIGISAVSAAAAFKARKPKRPASDQMS
ncbi:hypothetical protein [Prosthecomicrobium sp. N25]|uniref:hypothetical protein n=1 Tax=Prosthecomicrobium sp. N25 TaxID=3129254 RepID=UPI0030772A39